MIVFISKRIKFIFRDQEFKLIFQNILHYVSIEMFAMHNTFCDTILNLRHPLHLYKMKHFFSEYNPKCRNI